MKFLISFLVLLSLTTVVNADYRNYCRNNYSRGYYNPNYSIMPIYNVPIYRAPIYYTPQEYRVQAYVVPQYRQSIYSYPMTRTIYPMNRYSDYNIPNYRIGWR